ncbi:universal stress protein [Streptomyces sp. NPDC001941]|uniref:universal stress protein n=1 Tax=Streptomyces sp. NPDC001941 TaxID=3154659 RepID=UPI0033180626
MNSLPVLAAVDGSEHSLRALEWALDAARSRDAELLVVHVRPDYARVRAPHEYYPPLPEGPGDPVLDGVRELLAGRAGLPPVRYDAPTGTPAAVLAELSGRARMVVLGSRGRGGFASLLLGSTGRSLSAHAACPVVVVTHGCEPAPPVPDARRVVLGLDPRETDDEVVAFAFAEAERRGADLDVVSTYLVPLSALLPVGTAAEPSAPEAELARAQAERLRPYAERSPVTVRYAVAPGDAAGRLVTASEDASLVVVGRHRRRLTPGSLALGSTANAVLLHGHCPVVVVPPAKER